MNKNYVVISGASAGIGEATALQFAKNHFSLILLARRKKRLEKLKQKCLEVGAKEVLTFELDVTDVKERKALFADPSNSKIFSRVKTLVNNAGLAKGVELFQDSNPADWEQMFNTNVLGLMNLTKELLPALIKNQGHIVNIGSVAGRLVYEGGAVYCATKFAVRALTEGLRMDLKGSNIRVTNIEPGMVNTEFSLVRLGNQQKADAVYEGMRPLQAKDIAETIFWCVDRPAHVNIQELVIYPTDQASVGQVVRRHT